MLASSLFNKAHSGAPCRARDQRSPDGLKRRNPFSETNINIIAARAVCVLDSTHPFPLLWDGRMFRKQRLRVGVVNLQILNRAAATGARVPLGYELCSDLI